MSSLGNNIPHYIRENEIKKSQERKRSILVLIHDYLRNEGLLETVNCLNREAHVINSYEVCDNIDLATIVQEFESYYHLKFQKFPKLCRKSTPESKDNAVKRKETKKVNCNDKTEPKVFNKLVSEGNSNSEAELTIVPLLGKENGRQEAGDPGQIIKETFIKDPAMYPAFASDWKEFADAITKEISISNPNIHWQDVIGHENAKQFLKEAVIHPMKYPSLFTGILSPWKGLLLYGPTGTGKTMLARAVATESNTTFFNISASSIVSKWRGDSEKIIRVLFELARYHAPSTIFIDELDALASHRVITSEHEGSRRLKTEFLIHLDGLLHSDERVFFLATTNLPWELDAAFLRRLEKKILVGLPNEQDREALFKEFLPQRINSQPNINTSVNYQHLAQISDGYSGSDIRLICKEAATESIRCIIKAMESNKKVSSVKMIMTDDVEKVLANTKPTVHHLMGKYEKWESDLATRTYLK